MVSTYVDEPYYKEQLLHRSGRLMLHGKQAPLIGWVNDGLLEINTSRFIYDNHDATVVVLDATGYQAIPNTADKYMYRAIAPVAGNNQLMEAYTYGKYGIIRLLRQNGNPLTDKLFTHVQAVDSGRSIAFVRVPGSITYLNYGGTSTHIAVPQPLAGLLDLQIDNWLLTPH